MDDPEFATGNVGTVAFVDGGEDQICLIEGGSQPEQLDPVAATGGKRDDFYFVAWHGRERKEREKSCLLSVGCWQLSVGGGSAPPLGGAANARRMGSPTRAGPSSLGPVIRISLACALRRERATFEEEEKVES